MPFFKKRQNKDRYTMQNKATSLWATKCFPKIFFKFLVCEMSKKRKRVSFFTSSQKLKGSMTLEIAVIFPIILFAIFSLVSLIDLVRIESCMNVAVCEAGNDISVKSYGNKNSPIRSKIKSFLENHLSNKDMERLSYTVLVSDDMISENGKIDFQVNYQIEMDRQFFGLKTVSLNTRYYGHDFCGFQKKEEQEEMVYISDRETVYHVSRSCSHLNLTIYEVKKESLEFQRNQDGSKYKECDFCKKVQIQGNIYITPEGECYHNTRNCIGLTRTIYTVPLSTVSDKPKCTRCGEG